MFRLSKWSPMILLLMAMCRPAAAQGTYTAASCNYTDVNAVVNGPIHKAAAGDVIKVPAGSCTWTSQLSISAGITLIGSGTPNSSPSQFGAGTLNTTIIVNTGGAVINATVPSGQALRISSFLIQPVSSSTTLGSPIWIVGTCTSGGCPNLRIDNLNFTGWSEGGNGNQAGWMMRIDGMFGVVDHVTIPQSSGSNTLLANVHYSSWLGVGQYGDNSWASPDTFGTASQLYFENNSLSVGTLDCDETPGTTGGGCRFTVRFSQFAWPGNGNFSTEIAYTHGSESTGRQRGTRQVEIYGNSASCNNSQNGCDTAAVGMRSGTARVFGNSFSTNGGWYNKLVSLANFRVQANFNPWGTGDGKGPYDQNDGVVHYSGAYTGGSGSTSFVDGNQNWVGTFGSSSWASTAATAGQPYSIYNTTQGFGAEISSAIGNNLTFTNNAECNWGTHAQCTWNNGDGYQILRATAGADQPGRGAGSYISGSTPSPTGWVNEILDPIYEWANSLTGSGYNVGVFGSNTSVLRANRDYYNESKNQSAQTSPTSPFNGTSGTGHGTLTNRPSTCAQGVGYWASDQGNWNKSGNSFGQGVLYICGGTSVWSASYTPYQYPHPLVGSLTAGGSASSAGAPNPPTNLNATIQ